MVKNRPATAGDTEMKFNLSVRKMPWIEGMATHSSIPAEKIPWTEEPDGLQSMGSQRVGYNCD